MSKSDSSDYQAEIASKKRKKPQRSGKIIKGSLQNSMVYQHRAKSYRKIHGALLARKSFYYICLNNSFKLRICLYFRCKRQCTSLLNDEEKAAMISKLYDGRPKNELDTYLSGLEAKPVQRRRQRSEQNIKPRSSNFSYCILKMSERVPVCKQAFMSLQSVPHIQVKRLIT